MSLFAPPAPAKPDRRTRWRALPWATLGRAALQGAAVALLLWPLTRASGLLAAFAGTAAGVALGQRAAGSRLRTPALIALAGLLALVARGAASIATGPSALPVALGPARALALSEAILWGGVAFAVFGALRACAVRLPALAVLEAAVVAAGFGAVVAGHRDGMVHRPLALSNWAWARGIDPVSVLLVLGGIAGLLSAALLLHEPRRRRAPLHLAGFLLLAAALVLVVRVTGTPRAQAGSELGLQGQPKQGWEPQQRTGNPGGGEGARGERDDLPFEAEDPQSGANAPVAVVLLHGDYSPPSGAFYLRQTAFSQFNGRRLVKATRDDVDTDLLGGFPARRESLRTAPPLSDQRAALRTTVGLLADHPVPFALDSPAAVWPAQNPDPRRFRLAYGVESRVLTLPYDRMLRRAARAPGWSEAQWRHYTDSPTDPRYRALADEIVASRLGPDWVHDPLAQAIAIKMWLDKEGIYSRRSRHDDDAPDPVASFLFGDKTGYCVHFAHAATFLLRSRGVATRVAAGYALSEADRGSGSTLLVRGGDAHAWPEVYVEGVGWVVVDITPERSLDPPRESPDAGLQRMLGQSLRETTGELQEAGDGAPPFTWEDLRALLLRGLLVLLAAAYGFKAWRALAPRLRRRQAWRLAYREALDRLAEVGLRRATGESREGFARRVAPLAPEFDALTRGHLAVALGSRQHPPAAALLGASDAVRAALRARVPRWRRWLGWLDPTSTLFAR